MVKILNVDKIFDVFFKPSQRLLDSVQQQKSSKWQYNASQQIQMKAEMIHTFFVIFVF